MKYKDNWRRHLEVYDFVGMYENFVQYDMVQRLTDMYNMIFDYQRGQTICADSGTFGYRNGLKKQSGEHMLSIEMKYKDRAYRGVRGIAHTKWSHLDVTAPIQDGIRLDAPKLAYTYSMMKKYTNRQQVLQWVYIIHLK